MVRSSKSSAEHAAVRADVAPGSRFARRRSSSSRLEKAVSSRRREESGPPTKPSIAPRAAAGVHRETPITPVDSGLGPWQRAARTRTYSVVFVLAAVALGLVGLIAAALGHSGPFGDALWGIALGLVLAGLAVAFSVLRAFALRLEALAAEAEQRARPLLSSLATEHAGDPMLLLAHSLGKMSDRIEALTRELEQRAEEERSRVDLLVRERTRQLGEEISDLRRLLGPSKAFLSVDAQGNIIGSSSSVVEGWLGPQPEHGHFWEYFDRGGAEVASRFEAAWRDMQRGVPREIDLRRMPKSLAIGERYLALEYQAVQSPDGKLERLLVVLSDITVPVPDTSARA
jgi:hypothetical protein